MISGEACHFAQSLREAIAVLAGDALLTFAFEIGGPGPRMATLFAKGCHW